VREYLNTTVSYTEQDRQIGEPILVTDVRYRFELNLRRSGRLRWRSLATTRRDDILIDRSPIHACSHLQALPACKCTTKRCQHSPVQIVRNIQLYAGHHGSDT